MPVSHRCQPNDALRISKGREAQVKANLIIPRAGAEASLLTRIGDQINPGQQSHSCSEPQEPGAIIPPLYRIELVHSTAEVVAIRELAGYRTPRKE
jgi:hypothetical protein